MFDHLHTVPEPVQEPVYEAWSLMAAPAAARGPPDKIIAQVRPYQKAGMGYLIVRFPDAAYDTSGVELFGREVIGAV